LEIQLEKEQKSPVEFDLKVTVPASVMQEQVASGLTTIAQRATVPGFRKGKIPRKVLIQKFGEAVTQETLQQVLQDSYKQALTESEIEPIAPGEMSEISFNPGEPLTYKVTVETLPEYELPDFSGVSVQQLQPEASDEDVDQSLEGLRESSATLIPTDDPVDKDSLIVIDVQEIDVSGVPIVGRGQKDVQVDMSRQLFGEDFANRIIGKRCEEKAVFDLMGGKDAEGKPRKTRFEALIRNIQRKELPPIDDQLAQSVNPNLTSVDELRADLKKYIEARAGYQARQRMYRQVADELLKKVDFPVPPRMLEDYLERLAHDGAHSAGKEPDEEQLKKFKENYRTSAIWNLRWYMLRSRIIKEKKLKVDKQDTKAEIERLAILENQSPKDYESRMSPEQKQELQDDLMERKVFEFISKEVQIIPTPISMAEFEGRAGESKIETI
jgi:trigger factor